jgi:hypothetical protein
MAAGEAAGDKWRDEDGIPSPQEEFGGGDWWSKYECDREPMSFPPDHGYYLRELYDEIDNLRARVRELEAELAAERLRSAA